MKTPLQCMQHPLAIILLLIATHLAPPCALIVAEVLVIILFDLLLLMALLLVNLSNVGSGIDEVSCMSWKQCALRAFHGRDSVRIIDGDTIGEDPEV